MLLRHRLADHDLELRVRLARHADDEDVAELPYPDLVRPPVAEPPVRDLAVVAPCLPTRPARSESMLARSVSRVCAITCSASASSRATAASSPEACAAASRASACSCVAAASSMVSIGRIGTATSISLERKAETLRTASGEKGSGDHWPMTAPLMMGPESERHMHGGQQGSRVSK